ncbi:MAG: phosphate ABC transporter permease PstA [Planctomycetaceae bacterium]
MSNVPASSIGNPSRRISDFLAALFAWGSAILIGAVFFWILFEILKNGWEVISWEFLTESPRNAGRAGGIGPIIVSTFLILGVCLITSMPLGVGTAIFLNEYTPAASSTGRLIRRGLDVLAGVPSIVFGLFGNAIFCVYFGLGFSILSGGLTLACMVLPILIRSTEEGLRSVPNEYRLAAAGLGISRTGTLTKILLPAAMPGLIVGLVLGIGRALAETAALVFTSGYVDRMPGSLLHSGRALSVHIFDLSMNVAGGDRQAYGAAFVLIVLIVIINLLAFRITNRWLGNGRSVQ